MRDPAADSSARPCDGCPEKLLATYLDETVQGLRIRQTVDLDHAVQAGVSISLSDITYAEFLLLRYLNEERNRYQAEQSRGR